MKKLALIAAAAALGAVPAVADTGYSSKRSAETTPPGHSYTVIDRDMENDTVRYTTHTIIPPKVLPNGEFDYSGTYDLVDGNNRLMIDGKAAYLVESDGYRFFAPTSGYVTEKGDTIFVENGKLLRLEAPPEIVYVDSDDMVGHDRVE